MIFCKLSNFSEPAIHAYENKFFISPGDTSSRHGSLLLINLNFLSSTHPHGKNVIFSSLKYALGVKLRPRRTSNKCATMEINK